jgi:hypothetical protein
LPEQPARQPTASEQIIAYCIERSDTIIFTLPKTMYVKSVERSKRLATFTLYVNGINVSQ